MKQQEAYQLQQENYQRHLREAFAKRGGLGVSLVLGTGVSAALSGNHRVATWKGLLDAGLDWYASGHPLMAENVEHFRAVLDSSPTTEMLIAVAQFVGGQFRKSGGGEYQSWLEDQIGDLKIADNN